MSEVRQRAGLQEILQWQKIFLVEPPFRRVFEDYIATNTFYTYRVHAGKTCTAKPDDFKAVYHREVKEMKPNEIISSLEAFAKAHNKGVKNG